MKIQLGADSMMKRRCLQPSRKVRRCGGRLRSSGHMVMGTSAMRAPALAALMRDSEANSMPLVRKSSCDASSWSCRACRN